MVACSTDIKLRNDPNWILPCKKKCYVLLARSALGDCA